MIFIILYLITFLSAFVFFLKWTNSKRTVTLDKKWFPPIPEETQYQALVEQYGDEESSPHLLKILTSALVKRAMATIARMWDIQKEKPSLSQLVKEGVVGEDQLKQLTLAEEETEAKLLDIQNEAECYKDGWSKTILQESAQFVAYVRQQEAQREAQLNAAKMTQQMSPRQTRPISKEEELKQRKIEADKIAAELIKEEEAEKKKNNSNSGKKSKKQN